MHQVQLAITQMFDGVTQVLGEDIPLRRGLGCRLAAGNAEGADTSRTVSVGNGSGVARSAGSRPMRQSCPLTTWVRQSASSALCIPEHSHTTPLNRFERLIRSFFLLWACSGARDPPKRWTLSYDGFSSCFPVPILKLHSSCKFVCTQSRDQMTVMLLKHRNRRPHLTSEQMQISAPVHDLKCRVHVTQTTQGSILLCSYVFRPTVRCLKRCQPQADL